MRVIFMGTPEFSCGTLKSLHESADIDVVGVYTKEPKRSGRGKKITRSHVHELADELGLNVYHPKSLRNEEEQQRFANLNADIAIVVAYGLILPKEILDAPKYGCINIHASLLPRWRGAAPIQRAIFAGDKRTGICYMHMDEGLDTGDVIDCFATNIDENTTAQSLHDELARMGAKNVVSVINGWISGELTAKKQPAIGVTYAEKLTKEEGLLHFESRSAINLERQVRAFYPFPKSYFMVDDKKYEVCSAKVVDNVGEAGDMIQNKNELIFICKEQALSVLRIKPPSKKEMSIEEFLRGNKLGNIN